MPVSQKRISTKIYKYSAILLALNSTIGCMASVDDVTNPNLPTYADRRAIDVETVSNMVALYEAEGQAIYEDWPASGSAEYSGILDMEVVSLEDESIRFVADMTATVTFGPTEISGTASNFQDSSDVYHDGSLEMSFAGFNGSDDPRHVVDFDQVFTGSLVLPEGTLAVVANGDADFTGRNRNYMAGEAYGNVTLDGVEAGTVEIDYAVERQ